MTVGEGWFNQMSDAVRKREAALRGVARWEAKVQDAEDVIHALTVERDDNDPVSGAADLTRENDELPDHLRPVFGAGSSAPDPGYGPFAADPQLTQ